MSARNDSFDGLHVLLVTEDEARAQAIAKSLRERRAHVGDVHASAKDPVAMRGADLLVIDARRDAPRVANIDARVTEVRSDVRARWASVANIDFTTLAQADGSVDLRALENIVTRLAGMDKALTERARKETSFETGLAPLGPTRTLRALALAGPTLHVQLTDGALSAKVELADELLVAAFAEQKGERWEAWHALARVLGMTDANIVVQHRAHPTAMNIMEPVDQALDGAARERARSPELYEEEEREELSGLLGQRHATGASQVPSAVAHNVPVAQGMAARTSSAPMPASLQSATGSNAPRARGAISLPPESPGGKPQPAVHEHFADVPTDAAAPGLLQRMARMPANDAATPSPSALRSRAEEPRASTRAKSDPEISIEREPSDHGGLYDDEDDEHGEVTVVADASQLDILRETLGRLDEESGNQPLTSTMPAPPDGGDANALDLSAALREAGEAIEAKAREDAAQSALPVRASQPEEEDTQPVPSFLRSRAEEPRASTRAPSTSTPPQARAGGSGPSSAPSAKISTPSTSLPPESRTPSKRAAPPRASEESIKSGGPAATSGRAPQLAARISKPAGRSSARTWILVILALLAIAAVSLMMWLKQPSATKKPGLKPSAASTAKP